MTPYNVNRNHKITTNVSGVSIKRGFIAHFQVSAADAEAQDLTSVLAATSLTDSAQTITTNISNPTVPRSLRVKGNAVGITGDVVITGKNYANEEITETIALSGSDAVETTKAFKTITQIDLPVETHAGTDTVSVGCGNKLGLPFKLTHDTVLAAYRDNTKEGTAPTVTVSETNIENNTVLLNSAINGTAIDVYLMV